MDLRNIYQLPFDTTPEMDDLWTIFSQCPIERGKIVIYDAYCRAREKAFTRMLNAEKNKGEDNGMEM